MRNGRLQSEGMKVGRAVIAVDDPNAAERDSAVVAVLQRRGHDSFDAQSGDWTEPPRRHRLRIRQNHRLVPRQVVRVDEVPPCIHDHRDVRTGDEPRPQGVVRGGEPPDQERRVGELALHRPVGHAQRRRNLRRDGSVVQFGLGTIANGRSGIRHSHHPRQHRRLVGVQRRHHRPGRHQVGHQCVERVGRQVVGEGRRAGHVSILPRVSYICSRTSTGDDPLHVSGGISSRPAPPRGTRASRGRRRAGSHPG